MAVSVAPARSETDLRELLERIDRKLDLLLAHERQRPTRRGLSRRDRDQLLKMLPVLAGVYGSEETFSSRDLVEDPPSAVRLVVAGWSSRGFGQLFDRADGIPIDGLAVRRHSEECGVAQWHVVAC